MIVVLLIVRGKGLPVRGFIAEKLPDVGTGRVRPTVVIPLVAGAVLLISFLFTGTLVYALTESLAWATIMLSVVVLLGLTSQLSFEQMTMAGLSGLVAAQLVHRNIVSFPLAFSVRCSWPCRSESCSPAGSAYQRRESGCRDAGLLDPRVRRDHDEPSYTGGADGISLNATTLFGLSLNPYLHARRYAVVVLLVFVVCALVVANVRRDESVALYSRCALMSAPRRRWHRCAAVKVYAFVLASVIAGVGGIA